jgi:hypothetical protein
MTIPPEFVSPPSSPTSGIFTEASADGLVIEGAISVYNVITKYQALAQWVQAGIDAPVRAAMKTCREALIARGASIDKRYEWVLGLHVVSDGHTARLAEILVPDRYWPEVFDREAKDCWLRTLSAVTFPSDKIVDVTVEFPLCINPPENSQAKEVKK